MDLIKLSNIAIEAAQSAGKIIRQYMDDDNVQVEKKKGGTSFASQVVTEVDRACEKAILSHLQPTFEEDDLALLSEETEDDGGRFEKDYFWCIDPLDGTLAFIHKRPGFSVSIALIARDGSPCIGVVLDPIKNDLYHAIKGVGAFKNGSPWKISYDNDHLTFVSDRMLKNTRHADRIRQLLDDKAKKLQLNGVKEISGSGAVLNGIIVLENGPACMLKLPKKERGGGGIWDFAATACIFQELGLKATNFEGGRLDLNRRDGIFMNHQGVFYANFGKDQ